MGEGGFSFLAVLLSLGQCSRPCVEEAGKAPASYKPAAKSKETILDKSLG